MIRMQPVEGKPDTFKVFCKRREMGFIEMYTESEQIICGDASCAYTRDIHHERWRMLELDGKTEIKRLGPNNMSGPWKRNITSRKEAAHILSSLVGQRSRIGAT